MPLDQYANFVRSSVSAAINAGDTTVSVPDASIYPDPANGAFNVVLWNVDTYALPHQDPDVEIIRVTGRDTGTNTLTVTRAQEGTSDVAHPETAEVALTYTQKLVADIKADYLATGEDFDGQGTSDFTNIQSLGVGSLSVTNGIDAASVSAGGFDFIGEFQTLSDFDAVAEPGEKGYIVAEQQFARQT